MKRFEFDKVFHITETDIKPMRVLSPPLFFLFFLLLAFFFFSFFASLMQLSLPCFLAIKTEQFIIYLIMTGRNARANLQRNKHNYNTRLYTIIFEFFFLKKVAFMRAFFSGNIQNKNVSNCQKILFCLSIAIMNNVDNAETKLKP